MKKVHFEIAQEAIKDLGLDTQAMECQDKSLEWKNFLQKKSTEKETNVLYQKLANRDFIAIYCSPKDPNILGGDINVFIDNDTNEVLDILRGQ